MSPNANIDATDRALIEATQAGLPLVAEPYAVVAKGLGLAESEVIERLKQLKATGVIRRIGAAPNHYRLGMTANGMTVWDVQDARLADLGARIGELPFVTHCYERPRAPPDWPYNFFAMVHGSSREEVAQKRAGIAAILGDACRGHDILYSSRILKKTGLRLGTKETRDVSTE
jgi:siroheme decarboxylase